MVNFNTKSVNDVKTNVNSIVDFLGIVTHVSNLCTIHREDNSEVTKKTINLQDMS